MGNETVNQETQNVTTEQKTFTQEEVNSIIAERLGRDRQKYADYDSLKEKAEQYDKLQEANKSELEKANERANRLEAELADMKKANDVREIRLKVSNETGVPLNLLTADSEEDCKAQADAINAFAMPNKGYPKVSDRGEVSGSLKVSPRDQFAEAVKDKL